MEFVLQKQSLDDLQRLAEKLASFLSSGDILLMEGDLGSGKTALTKMLVAELGDPTIKVSSPTFNIVQTYESPDLKFPVHHFDAYRLEGIGGMDQGFEDYLFGEGISIIEWAQFMDDIIPENALTISFQRNLDDPDNYRDITISSVGENGLH
ncbi:MAG: tRNA (adenosine(37)-N6)-threonylcarbamoyltransferase complex ATPase subunit type 1 TsaE [Lactobacillaceae bacterium]|jgi:tRNA threonylcarbamoyladenosine biosynthesis protein TsaE|nr:tRNA (adenosine(37)-N6)-threonylcarbamoyltransferase complex ATPase subunit type 1 TsaE [Lactobacillaceae bacterium]